MDSLRRRRPKKYLPPLPRNSKPAPIQKPELSFSHSFSLPPQQPPLIPEELPPENRGRKRKVFTFRFIWKTILFLLIAALLSGIILLFWRASQVSRVTLTRDHSGNILAETAKQLIGKKETERTPLQGEADGRVNILLLGKATKDYPGQDLTDTIIVASIDTKNKQTALISLPRDLYVKIPNTNTSTKLNALYFYSKNEDDPFKTIRSVVADITGLPIHYAIAIDYDGFTRIVDALGGINVTVPQDFYDPKYPGPNYSYEPFTLSKGFHTLDGKTALKYVRERHDDPQGDFGRSARQQQVIEAVKNKAFTVQTFLNPFTLYSLLGTLEKNIRTDLSLKEIESLLSLIQEVNTQNIHTLVVDAWKKESLLRVSHIALENGQQMFVLVPRTGTYREIQDTVTNIFTADDRIGREVKIREENPHILIINTTKNTRLANSVSDLLSDLGFENREILPRIDAPDLSRTYVRKLSSRNIPYSLDEIMKQVPATLSGESLEEYLPKKVSEEADFAIILGNDISDNYLWEKGTVEEYLRGNE